jgi:hypothetical protein
MNTIIVAGTKAIDELHRLRADFPANGLYPVMIGNDEELGQVEEMAEFTEETPEEIIAAAETLDLREWITERQAEAESYGYSEDEILGSWPGEIAEKGSILLHADILSGQPKPKVNIRLVALTQAWHLPAHLKWGGWNECPTAEVQCAFFQRWEKAYGAQITGMSGDIVECLVTNPPTTKDEAMKLAWEQYWYCADIVEQGVETVSNLAATLINSPYWYFWWD